MRGPATLAADGDSQGADPDAIRKDLRTLAEKAFGGLLSPAAERALATFDEASHDGRSRTCLPAFWAICTAPADFEGDARA